MIKSPPQVGKSLPSSDRVWTPYHYGVIIGSVSGVLMLVLLLVITGLCYHKHTSSRQKLGKCKLQALSVINSKLQVLSIIVRHCWHRYFVLTFIYRLEKNMEYISGNAFTYTQTWKTKKMDIL